MCLLIPDCLKFESKYKFPYTGKITRTSNINIMLHFLDIVIVIIFLSFCLTHNATYGMKRAQRETGSLREISQI